MLEFDFAPIFPTFFGTGIAVFQQFRRFRQTVKKIYRTWHASLKYIILPSSAKRLFVDICTSDLHQRATSGTPSVRPNLP